MGTTVLDNLKKHLVDTKYSGTSEKSKKQAHDTLWQVLLTPHQELVKKHIQSVFGVRMKRMERQSTMSGQWLARKGRKPWKDKIPDEVRQEVQDFFLSAEISREVPCKREIIKVKDGDKVTEIPKHLMFLTYKEAYDIQKAAS